MQYLDVSMMARKMCIFVAPGTHTRNSGRN
jgi:hypothetical protein